MSDDDKEDEEESTFPDDIKPDWGEGPPPKTPPSAATARKRVANYTTGQREMVFQAVEEFLKRVSPEAVLVEGGMVTLNSARQRCGGRRQ